MKRSWRFPNGEIVAVNEPYYPASCDKCGWQGSSEVCGIDTGGDDSDVYCPSCHASGADIGKAGNAASKVIDGAQISTLGTQQAQRSEVNQKADR